MKHNIIISNSPFHKGHVLATYNGGKSSQEFLGTEEVKKYFAGLFWEPVYIDRVDYTANHPTFEECKKELSKRRENVKYFTREFFKTFSECFQKNGQARTAGTVEKESYIAPGENFERFKFYIPVYESDFYNKNSCCYCEFLSVWHNA